MFLEKIKNRQSGILLYGLTPPRATYDPEKLADIAQKHSNRINNLPIDGVIFYDIQDESLRNNSERPFKFLPTLDPLHYCELYLKNVNRTRILYQCVGKYSHESFSKRLQSIPDDRYCAVFVGVSSAQQQSSLKLDDAYRIRKQIKPSLMLGGITIPERHSKKLDEHFRICEKNRAGCEFFVSQAVYDVQGCKNMLSDYYYYTMQNNLSLSPQIFTLTPCGSLKTLQFMEWLGIHIPGWLKNDLIHSGDILQNSLNVCLKIAEDLVDFCRNKKIPLGFNIESVSIRKEEIDASIDLLQNVSKLLI